MSLLAPLSLALSIALGACGGTDNTRTARRTAPQTRPADRQTTDARAFAPPHGAFRGDEDDDETGEHLASNSKDNDVDFDNDLKNTEYRGYHDADDRAIAAFGRPANAFEKHEVTILVKHYYQAAAAGDGARACALIYSTLMEAIPEDYGQSIEPSNTRSSTCAVVMSKLFKHSHSQVVVPFEITSVRVKDDQGYALFGSGDVPAGDIAIKRERGIWKINGLLGGPLQ